MVESFLRDFMVRLSRGLERRCEWQYCSEAQACLPGDVYKRQDCKHFSKAKGGKPVEKHIRDLAWVVVHWAKRVRPAIIMLENVEEFKDWGPLISTEDGQLVPCPLRKGFTFRPVSYTHLSIIFRQCE